MTLYLLQFNNYYNRIVRFYPTAAEYVRYLCEGGDAIIGNVNFIPNDGVSTTQDINWNGTTPDYVLAVDDTGNINSRWYVIESVRLRNGQYRLSLYRDLVADYYEEILNAPIFVEKGPLSASNPLLFNQEDMTFNQIRKEPILLYDRSECPWVVGYIPNNAFTENTQISKKIGISADNADFEVEDLETWKNNNYFYYPGFYDMNSKIRIRYQKTNVSGYNRTTQNEFIEMNNNYDDTFKKTVDEDSAWNGTYLWVGNVSSPTIDPQTIRHAFYDNTTNVSYLNGFRESNYNIMTSADYQGIEELKGKIIKDTSTGEYYTIEVSTEVFEEDRKLSSATALRSAINTAFLNSVRDSRGAVVAPTSGTLTSDTYSVYTTGIKVSVNLKQVFLEVKTTITNDRFHLEDQPFDMFCIPLGYISMLEGHTLAFSSKPEAAYIATAIAEMSGKDNIYDVQVLPYSPVSYAFIEGSNTIDLAKIKYSLITDDAGANVSAVLWCRQSNFRVDLPYEIPSGGSAANRKINSQTKKYRLVSPNYGSIFEFDPEKNGGVSGFFADCSYKPFNPYIRIAPVFKDLYGYGGQYDARGLILSGDFSLPRVENAWANYQLQNKNYQAIFDRQIENLEVQNKYQRINDIVGGIAGTVQGGVSGAMSGAMMGSAGGPYGMAAGAAIGGTVGTVAAAAGGVADYYINEALRKETLDMTKDQFGYQLGNIQALPNALAKTSALTINNPLVPMLEKYECSQEEFNAFLNKLMYNGMTVMTIGTLGEYVAQKNFTLDYFKGKLIRIEGLADDSHVATAIASELNKGVYI